MKHKHRKTARERAKRIIINAHKEPNFQQKRSSNSVIKFRKIFDENY